MPPSKPIQVVLRVPNKDGRIDMTESQRLGEGAHPYAFVTRVTLLGQGRYRLEDPWHTHPLALTDDEEAIGGLAFKDVFVAKEFGDGSLRFERIVQKGNWRVINWFLGSILGSRHLMLAFTRVAEHGGFAEEDPWIGGGWLWIFLPPDTDYDPLDDFNEAIKAIPREEILSDYEEWRKRMAMTDAGPS